MPSRVVWSVKTVSAASLGKHFDQTSPQEQLTIFAALQHCKGNMSMWQPYVGEDFEHGFFSKKMDENTDSAPKLNEMTNALFWTEDEVKELQVRSMRTGF